MKKIWKLWQLMVVPTIMALPVLVVISCGNNDDPSSKPNDGKPQGGNDPVDWTDVEDNATEVIDWTEIEDNAVETIDWIAIEDTAKEVIDWIEIGDLATEVIDWIAIEDTAKEVIEWTEIQDNATEVVEWTEIQDNATEVIEWTEIQDNATEVIDWTEIQDIAKEVIDWIEITDNATEVIDWTLVEDTAKEVIDWIELLPSTPINPTEPDMPIINSGVQYDSKWGVGSGKKWDSKVYVPFVDFLSSSNYTNSTPNLVDYANHTGANYYNLGFINMIEGAYGTNPSGSLKWSWGGFASLTEGSSNPQYGQIKKNIKDFRATGGDVTISFGGAAGTPFWMSSSATEDNLVKTYVEIIEGYGLSRIDLDIEGGGENFAKNELNARAIKRVQDLTGVEVVLTLPVDTNGLYNGYTNTQTYLKAGVDITAVNIMSMYLGVGVGVDGIIQSIDETKYQLQDIWMREGKTLTDAQAYALLGVTPSIGYENNTDKPVSADDWLTVSQYAESKNLSILSMWVANRDALDGWYSSQPSKPGGVKIKWQYGNIGRDNFDDENNRIAADPIQINDLNATNLTFQDADLNWSSSAPEGTKTYVYLAEENQEYQLAEKLSGNSVHVTNLKSETKYYAVLANVNENGDHLFSNVINFQTKPRPVDQESPVLADDINIDHANSSMSKLVFSFAAATDDVGIKQYMVYLKRNGSTIKQKLLTVNADFQAGDEYINTSFEGLERLSDYQIQIVAYDFSEKYSNVISANYQTGDYPVFDYSKSNTNAYQVGDIVAFTSTDSDWANVGKRYYKKTKSWGQGWAPDGSSFGSQNSTSFAPGSVDPSTTGWDIYYG